MGGSGAKNRRKQQRLSSEGYESLGVVVGPESARQGFPAKSSSSSNPPARSFPPTTRSEKFHTAPTMLKKKSKKPKHLKRKLATVSGDDDREHLLHVLKEFERKKSNLSGPPAKKARPSPENETIANAPNISTEDHLKASLPRVEKKENRPSASTVEVSTKDAKNPYQDELKAAVVQGKKEMNEKTPSTSAVEVSKEDAKKEAEAKTKQKKPDQSGPPSKKAKPSLESKSIPIVATTSTKQKATAVSLKHKKENESSASHVEPATKEENKPSKTTVKSPPAAKTALLKDADDSSDSDSDSDSDGSVSAEEPSRQRGKRRRGRQDTSKQILEKAPEESTASSQTDELKDPKAPDPSKKTMKKDDKRSCVGRKPVTDFSVGQKYDAKVVYMKPFGIFLDIGSHSDAFCHVSRLQDEFIESPNALFKEGDTVSARVVEIDRRKKRITVSLQSDGKMEDERSSVEAHAKRREKYRPAKNAQSGMEETEHQNEMEPTEMPAKQQQPTTPRGLPTKPESEMNQAELKRARKLARRAERRENQETTADE
jgi:predicted RNA-binding protein with RPS1 domain